MKEIGKMTNRMDSENTSIQTELFTKVNGRMISKTVEESKSGPTDKGTKESFKWVLSLARVF